MDVRASITNRTNVLKVRQENTLDFMRAYGILLPQQKFCVLKKAGNCFCFTAGGLTTQIPNHRAGFYKPHIYMLFFSSYIATEETHIAREIQWS